MARQAVCHLVGPLLYAPPGIVPDHVMEGLSKSKLFIETGSNILHLIELVQEFRHGLEGIVLGIVIKVTDQNSIGWIGQEAEGIIVNQHHSCFIVRHRRRLSTTVRRRHVTIHDGLLWVMSSGEDGVEVLDVDVQLLVELTGVSVKALLEESASGIEAVEDGFRVHRKGGRKDVRFESGTNFLEKYIQVGPLIDVHQIPIRQGQLERFTNQDRTLVVFIILLGHVVVAHRHGPLFILTVRELRLMRQELRMNQTLIHIQHHNQVRLVFSMVTMIAIDLSVDGGGVDTTTVEGSIVISG
eukprot:scaffold421175_cov51-Attheya_sp.AAC.4